MSDIEFLRSLGLMIIAGAAFALLARPARVPTIVAYILAGLLLGPLTGLLAMTEATELIAQTGIVLLLFLVGSELSLDDIRGVGRVAIVGGFGQVTFTAVGGFGMALAFGFPALEAAVLATALTFSSTIIPVKILTEKGEMRSLYGRIVVGVSMVQSLLAIVILALLAGLGGSGELDLRSTGLDILRAFVAIALLLAAALLTGRHALNRLFAWISPSLEALFIWSLCWCFLVVVAAERAGLSIEIGAIIAGLSLAQHPYNQELRRRVRPLMNFFIAIFFISLGIGMNLEEAARQWAPAAVFSLFVLLGNPFSIIWLIARVGYGERTAFLAGLAVAQISEFSFIFAALARTTGLIGDEVLATVTMVGLITMAVSAYLILYNGEIYERLRGSPVLKVFRAPAEPPPRVEEPVMADHVIVVGMNALGLRIARELTERGERVLVVDTDPRKLALLELDSVLGSADDPAVLAEANIEGAKLVVSAVQIEDTNNLLAYRCRALDIPCSIHAFDPSVVGELRELGANHLMISKNNGIRRILETLRELGVVGT